MSGFRNLFALGGEHPPSGRTSLPIPRQSSTKNNNLSWAEVDQGDDASAPNVAGNFGRARGEMHLNLPQGENLFTFGGSGTFQAPPAGVPPQWGDLREAIPAHPQIGIPRIVAQGPSQPQAALAAPTVQYSGMAATIKKWGIGDTVTQSVELQWQQGVAGKKTKITQFQDVPCCYTCGNWR